jgi:hypothetical protein
MAFTAQLERPLTDLPIGRVSACTSCDRSSTASKTAATDTVIVSSDPHYCPNRRSAGMFASRGIQSLLEKHN